MRTGCVCDMRCTMGHRPPATRSSPDCTSSPLPRTQSMALRAATRISFVATALLSSSFLMTSTRAFAAAPPSSFYDIKETDTAGAEVIIDAACSSSISSSSSKLLVN